MTRDELLSRFPEMTLVNGAPSLFLLNGCGLTVYGKRDYDGETGTYVKTHYLALIFVPVLALGSYRVADARGGGWYFIGRVPLSGLAKIWNLCVFGLLAGIISLSYLSSYTNSPEYKAAQELARADELRATGNLKGAAKSYIQLMSSGTPSAETAEEHLGLLLKQDLGNAPVETAANIVKMVSGDRKLLALDPGLYDRAMGLVKKEQEKNPVKVLELCTQLTPLAGEAKDHAAFREQLLEKIVAADPQHVEAASQLALLYEARGDNEHCVKLLEPIRTKLGLTEGARILGQAYARQDRAEDSYQLLMPYAEGRLKRLHDAEKAYEKAMTDVEKASLNELKNGRAPEAFYRAYERLDKEGQARKVAEYMTGKLKASSRVQNASKDLEREASVVPVALDLGIVRLRRAQEMTDQIERKKELEGAEKVFMAIQGVAGETDEFRVFNGKVKYWLGKHDEGKKLFDEFLASKKRDAKSLLLVGNLMREVGDASAGRLLTEEAYKTAKDEGVKNEAAHQRSVWCTDLDDEVLWLDRCKSDEPGVQASRASARGRQALRDNRKEDAARAFAEAMQLYQSMPKSSVSLNNAAIECQNLYAATGRPADFRKSCELLEAACLLDPKQSILLSNLCYQLQESVAVDVLATAADWRKLDEVPTLELLDVFYTDKAGYDQWRDKCISHANIKREQGYREKLTVLSPKSVINYAALVNTYSFTRDLEALKSVQQRTLQQTFDDSESVRLLQDSLAGKKDEQARKTLMQNREKYEKLMTELDGPNRGLEWVIAVILWSDVQAKCLDVGLPVDLSLVIKRLEEAEQVHPNVRTRKELAIALLERAAEQVAKEQKSFDEVLRVGRRAYGTYDLIGLAMEQEAAVRDAFVKNPDFQRALAFRKAVGQVHPDQRAVWEWALFRVCDQAETDAIVQSERLNACAQLEHVARLHLFPFMTRTVMDQYWHLEMEGKTDEARAVLAGLKKYEMPVPVKL